MPKPALTPRMISDFCRLRLAKVLNDEEREAIGQYLIGLVELMVFPPYRGRWIDFTEVSIAAGVELTKLQSARHDLQPIFDAVSRSVAMQNAAPPPTSRREATRTARTALSSAIEQPGGPIAPKKRGPKPKLITEFPEPLWTQWEEPETLSEALVLHMRRHGDSVRHLFLALASAGSTQDQSTLMKWCTGQLVPRTVNCLGVLRRIEHRYRLPEGYFRSKLPNRARAMSGHGLEGIPAAERRRLAWHLPDDFMTRPKAEQEEILAWVRRVIISGSTDYRRFQAESMKQRYAIRFTALAGRRKVGLTAAELDEESVDVDAELESAVADAPLALDAEMNELLRFKTATLTAFGFQRNGVWNDETASQKVEHLGLMFGALASDPRSTVKGCGVPLDSLCFGMLVFPAVWDWYLQWRERRRGFYTKWEVDMLSVVLGLTRADTGWIRQTPGLADRLRPIPGLVSAQDIAGAKADWNGACDAFHKHGRHRIKEIQRVARFHRDPFEPILPVLEAHSPVGEYRKITEEIVRLMPDERRYPRCGGGGAIVPAFTARPSPGPSAAQLTRTPGLPSWGHPDLGTPPGG